MERLRYVAGSFTFRCTSERCQTFTTSSEERKSKPDLGSLGNVLEVKPSGGNPDICELGILSGYRPPYINFKDCMRSVFQIHNETFNIWTQIIPAIYFFVQLLVSNEPFMVLYLLTVTALLVSSACAHTFSCISSFARHVCFFFDYSAITLYSSGCAVGYYAFALPKGFYTMSVSLDLDLPSVYLTFSVILSAISTYLSCSTRFWKPSFYMKVIRLMAFFIVWVYLSAPIAWRMVQCQQFVKDSHTGECASVYFWALQYISSVLAGIFYISHFPERCFPGKFDICAHSHQIFHILGASAAFNQFRALNVDSTIRFGDKHVSKFPPSLSLSLFCVFSVLTVNLLIFRSFLNKLRLFHTRSA